MTRRANLPAFFACLIAAFGSWFSASAALPELAPAGCAFVSETALDGAGGCHSQSLAVTDARSAKLLVAPETSSSRGARRERPGTVGVPSGSSSAAPDAAPLFVTARVETFGLVRGDILSVLIRAGLSALPPPV